MDPPSADDDEESVTPKLSHTDPPSLPELETNVSSESIEKMRIDSLLDDPTLKEILFAHQEEQLVSRLLVQEEQLAVNSLNTSILKEILSVQEEQLAVSKDLLSVQRDLFSVFPHHFGKEDKPSQGMVTNDEDSLATSILPRDIDVSISSRVSTDNGTDSPASSGTNGTDGPASSGTNGSDSPASSGTNGTDSPASSGTNGTDSPASSGTNGTGGPASSGTNEINELSSTCKKDIKKIKFKWPKARGRVKKDPFKKCQKCKLVNTHTKECFGLPWIPENIPGKVYKGICLFCFTRMEAKMELGEPFFDENDNMRIWGGGLLARPTGEPTLQRIAPHLLHEVEASLVEDEVYDIVPILPHRGQRSWGGLQRMWRLGGSRHGDSVCQEPFHVSEISGTLSMTESESRVWIDNCSDGYDIVESLGNLASSANVESAFMKLRRTNFASSSCGNAIIKAMLTHSSNESVLTEGLLTIWTIALAIDKVPTISDTHIASITVAMEIHLESEPIQEYGSGLLACVEWGLSPRSYFDKCERTEMDCGRAA